MTQVRVFRDVNASSIFFGRSLIGTWPYNCLQAIGNEDGTVSIGNLAKVYPNEDIVFEIKGKPYQDFIDDAGMTWGNTEEEVVNNLNAIFRSSGGLNNLPSITSASSISLTEGDSLNYELTADNGVGYEWEGLPPGVVTKEGNFRKLVGGSGLTAGTYGFTATAINYNGSDSQFITLGVTGGTSSSFVDTKSIYFERYDYMQANADSSNPLYRLGNGTGSSDAWSISFWMKAGTNNSANQHIISFGGNSRSNEGRVAVKYDGQSDNLSLWYGTNNNYLRLVTGSSTIDFGTWTHWVVTYDGGTTGVASDQMSTYYGRFAIYKNGASISTTNSHSNYGFSGQIVPDLFYISRLVGTGQYTRNSYYDEIALFDVELSSGDVSTIYNNGDTSDLSLLGTPPVHWWRMGDGDTFPTISDNIGSLDFTMYNMSVDHIVTDTPGG